MQTQINATMAMGVPGEHGNTQPYFADSYTASANVTMGTPVVVTGTTVAPATGATADGIAVSPHEHVRMVLPDGTQSLVVKTGDTVAVAKKGSWFVKAAAGWTVGTKLNYAAVADATPSGLVANTSGTVAVVIGTATGGASVLGEVACIRFL